MASRMRYGAEMMGGGMMGGQTGWKMTADRLERIVALRGGIIDSGVCKSFCSEEVPAGDGFAARFGERPFRVTCAACLDRLKADPGPYVAAGQTCSGGAEAEEPPASDWACY